MLIRLTKSDLAILEGVDPDYKEAAMQAYIKDLSLQDAMAKAQELQKRKKLFWKMSTDARRNRNGLNRRKLPEKRYRLPWVFQPKQEPVKEPEMPFGEPSVGAFEAEKEIAVRVMVPESRMEEFEQAMQDLFMRYEVI